MSHEAKDIQLSYDHPQGAIELRLPSGTRIGFKRESGALVFSVLNWLHMQPQAKLREPMTQSEVNKLVARFLANGNTVIKPLAPAPPNVSLEELGL